MSGWIGVDLDGTLAMYEGWKGANHIGEPVPKMVARVKRWLEEGREVRIFTARVFPLTFVIEPDTDLTVYPSPSMPVLVTRALETAAGIRDWCRQHIGVVLPITCTKDYAMIELWDDRCVQVLPNTGEPVLCSTSRLP